MSATQLNLREEDAIRMVLEFLFNRNLHITQLSLERETGAVNGNYADDMLFLRQLILDGQWDDIMEFIQPLASLKSFDTDKVRSAILKAKYMELLFIRSETPGNKDASKVVNEIIETMNALDEIVDNTEYTELERLFTIRNIKDHVEFRKWNPSTCRVQCFREVYPLLEPFLPCDRKSPGAVKCSRNDRLMQLLIKGILYESCVNFCQAKVTGAEEANTNEVLLSKLIGGSEFDESDLCLMSWLQSIPSEIFGVPFEKRMLNVNVEKLEVPSLLTSWTEHMLVTPIKPKAFPHIAMPFKRPKSATDGMATSLRTLPERRQALKKISQSVIDCDSPPGFHLFDLNLNTSINSSVDKLFNNPDVRTSFGLTPLNTSVTNKAQEQLNPTITWVPQTPTPLAELTMVNCNRSPREVLRDYQIQKTIECEDYIRRLSLQRDSSSEDDSNPQPSTSKDTQSGSHSNRAAQTVKAKPSNAPQNNNYVQYVARSNCSSEEDTNPQASTSKDTQSGSDSNGAAQTVKAKPSNAPRNNNYEQYGARSNCSSEEDTNPQASTSKDTQSGSDSNGAAQTVKAKPSNAPRNNNYEQYGARRKSSDPVNSRLTVLSQHAVTTQNIPPQAKMNELVPENRSSVPGFNADNILVDVLAIRCGEFHPSGNFYAIGSNSKTLRICAYSNLKESTSSQPPEVLLRRTKHHKGSIYCLAWNPAGDMLATGSNDKCVKILRFNARSQKIEGPEMEFTMHDGTVRDVCFIEDSLNKSSLLCSGGAGDCKLHVTDCSLNAPYLALGGHSGPILSLYNWSGSLIASSSQDKTIRIWDLRTASTVNIISPENRITNKKSGAISSVTVDPNFRVMVSGNEDGSCDLFDLRGNRYLQRITAHSAEVRSVRLSPGAYHLLTAGYDNRIVLTDLQGDLTCPLQQIEVARHNDKVTSARWHPEDYTILSTSADKKAIIWRVP